MVQNYPPFVYSPNVAHFFECNEYFWYIPYIYFWSFLLKIPCILGIYVDKLTL